jgi:hypothetical protein
MNIPEFDPSAIVPWLLNNLVMVIFVITIVALVVAYAVHRYTIMARRFGGTRAYQDKIEESKLASSSFGVRGDTVHVVAGPMGIGKTRLVEMLTYTACEHGHVKDVTREDDITGKNDRGAFGVKTPKGAVVPHVLQVLPDGPLASQYPHLSGKTITIVDLSGEMFSRAADGEYHPRADAVLRRSTTIIPLISADFNVSVNGSTIEVVSNTDDDFEAKESPIDRQVAAHERFLHRYMPRPLAFPITKLDKQPRALGTNPVRSLRRRLIRLIQCSSNPENLVIVPTNPCKWKLNYTEMSQDELRHLEDELGVWDLWEFIVRESAAAIIKRRGQQ